MKKQKKIVDTGYNRARQILTDNIDKLHQVAGILLEKEKIEADEFEAIFGKTSINVEQMIVCSLLYNRKWRFGVDVF